MLKFLSLVSALVVVESSYLGNVGLGTSYTSGYGVGLNNGAAYGIGNAGLNSYGSISSGSNNLGGAGIAGNAVVSVSTIPAGHAQAIPTAFSTQSRFDIIHPGSLIQQTVSQVPVVSTQIRPVAVAVDHGHGAHH
ncbi:unnamed protein product [Ceutorhynchus assimilis]|uniref:Uncharacterized protein n=1 Tax=Ceutorhynchus assimilis TaxID=467358 RepID=A0A9N9MUV1_9CUCU|nr:unnamed protein product [Ceutorhynchus assimilis]